jgi:MtN3 and saliva related transmembrane protein
MGAGLIRMDPSTVQVLGFVAAALTTLAFVPQALLTWRRRRAEGVSLGMYALFTLGVALWLVYGVAIHAWPVIISNAVTLLLALFILGMKIKHG